MRVRNKELRQRRHRKEQRVKEIVKDLKSAGPEKKAAAPKAAKPAAPKAAPAKKAAAPRAKKADKPEGEA
jgi:hypothetical protein